jgi:hypothetical protein
MNYTITKITNGYLLQATYPNNTYVYYNGYTGTMPQSYYATLDEVVTAIKAMEQGNTVTVTLTSGETTGYIGETKNG